MARILLAEDDDNMRFFLARALERAGHLVSAVGDGNAALALFDDEDFDLLLADVVMPGLDGVELARRAGALVPSLRIMFITGFAAVALARSGTSPRQPKILAKPFHLRQLVTEVEKALAG
jgi:two-component system cell cycle response regulator CpdR